MISHAPGDPEFLEITEATVIHAHQLALYGGSEGVRDPGGLDSAVQAAQNAYYYGEQDLFLAAAAYAFHIAENQPFVDGNKRTGLQCALVFLEVNGVQIFDPGSTLAAAMLRFSDHTLDKPGFAEILRALRTP